MGENKQQAHKALYRKYRPKSLDNIIGQDHVTSILRSAVRQNKINHAYLFTGPRGTGKTSIARILAYEINKIDYTNDSQQLDIIEIDAASNRRIDDIRELREKVHIAPVSSAYKVYIIDEVHMLTTESFNALLKTLEEPPSHVIFILATTEIHKLPATILSRVQRHSFRLIDTEEVAQHLATIAEQEEIDIDTTALKLLAKHGGGSFRDSISLLDQLSAHGSHIDELHVQQLLGVTPTDSVIDLLERVENGEYSEILESIESLITRGLTPAGIATALLDYMRTALLEKQDKTYYLELMQQLLDVAAAPYKQLKLETTLLKVNGRSANRQGIATNEKATLKKSISPAKNAEQIKPSKSNSPPVVLATRRNSTDKAPETAPTEIHEEKNDTVKYSQETEENTSETALKPNQESQDIISSWQSILDSIKVKHNPLYTLLRVGTPSISNETLTLAFSFPFHKKKLDDPKYKALLAETISELIGGSIQIESVVDKTTPDASSQRPEEDPAHASQISAVQAMMGGGEVVNV